MCLRFKNPEILVLVILRVVTAMIIPAAASDANTIYRIKSGSVGIGSSIGKDKIITISSDDPYKIQCAKSILARCSVLPSKLYYELELGKQCFATDVRTKVSHHRIVLNMI
jgi:hypothetical protein